MQYIVQPGDTLAIIAQKFGTTVEAIVRANNITNPNLIYVGQVLTIPSGTVPPVPVPPPVPTPPPAPGPLCPVLRRGDRGPAVRRLQQLLQNAGVSPGAIDGIFGGMTDAAVRTFQARRGLAVTGVANVATWTALGQNCGVGPVPPIPPIPPGPPTPTPPEYHCPLLRLNDRGPTVRFLQRLLREKGVFRGQIDGVFGLQTQRAVRLFQRQQGLAATGVVNHATWQALGVNCADVPAPPAGTPIDTRVARGIRHILFTDKRIYNQGDRAKITLVKTNITDDEINLRYSTSQIIEITIRNAAGNVVWRLSQNKSFAQFTRLITIFPGGTQVINEFWNLTNNAGNRVPAGNYTISVENLATNAVLSVQVQVR